MHVMDAEIDQMRRKMMIQMWFNKIHVSERCSPVIRGDCGSGRVRTVFHFLPFLFLFLLFPLLFTLVVMFPLFAMFLLVRHGLRIGIGEIVYWCNILFPFLLLVLFGLHCRRHESVLLWQRTRMQPESCQLTGGQVQQFLSTNGWLFDE